MYHTYIYVYTYIHTCIHTYMHVYEYMRAATLPVCWRLVRAELAELTLSVAAAAAAALIRRYQNI